MDYVGETAFKFLGKVHLPSKHRDFYRQIIALKFAYLRILNYNAMDLGLRNARLNFRQQERSHLMENLIYNELILRGYFVDVGIVEVSRLIDGKRKSSQYEIDFVVNLGNNKVYIQSALHVDTPEKNSGNVLSTEYSRLL